MIFLTLGGGEVHSDSSSRHCLACQSCLEKKSPKPKKQLLACPICRGCSLDCSHFIKKVFNSAGIPVPYLTTSDMLSISDKRLESSGYIRLAATADIKPADLLVYRGHVVLVEEVRKRGMGDVIHATSGKEVKGPGQGVQRARYVDLKHFRGPVLAILRLKKLMGRQPTKKYKFRHIPGRKM